MDICTFFTLKIPQFLKFLSSCLTKSQIILMKQYKWRLSFRWLVICVFILGCLYHIKMQANSHQAANFLIWIFTDFHRVVWVQSPTCTPTHKYRNGYANPKIVYDFVSCLLYRIIQNTFIVHFYSRFTMPYFIC